MIIRTLMPSGLFAVIFSLISLSSFAQPTANFSANPLSGCAPLVVNFTDLSTGNPTQWRWDLGNGTSSVLQNPSVTYFNPGQYTVKLVVQNAAGRDSLIRTQYITIYAQPVVQFNVSTRMGCFPLTVNFTDASIPGSGSISSWQWDFGDGNLSTLQNPTHTYTSSGNFNVSLRVTNSNGCTKTLTRSNYINIMAEPQAGFTVQNPNSCRPPATVQFQNTSTGAGSLMYQWNFGDGQVSTQTNPSHTYTAAGSYTVSLVVINQNGCRDSIVRQNVVNIQNFQGGFQAPDSVCVNTAFTITNTTNPPASTTIWNFGDGTSSLAPNPTVTYTTPGTYTIQQISQVPGCADTITRSVTVKATPIAAFTGNPTSSCSAPLTVNFVNGSMNGSSYQWDFGDGSTSTATNPSHTYTANGQYTVSLTVFGPSGCSQTITETNYIQVTPPTVSIDLLPQGGCAPFSWTFTPTLNTTEPIASYAWDFGDGSTSTQANPTHIFNPGVFDITLIVVTASGCRDTVVVPQGIRAGIRPRAAFSGTPLVTCAFQPVIFSDSSTGNVTNWFWDFGDGGTSILQNPEYTYTDTGYFTVMLIVMNNGCPDTLIKEDYVQILPPIANFNNTFSCTTPRTRTFVDRSVGADEWNWDFGDGNTSTVQNPVHTYANTGVYRVTLVVRNTQTGCSHDKQVTVRIVDEPIDFLASHTVVCKKDTVFFSTPMINPANIASYAWTFGNGSTGTGPNPFVVYNNPGNYTVRLITTDPAGCKDTLTRNQYIRVNGPTAAFVSSSPGTCMNTLVQFTDQSVTDGVNPIVQWIWNYGDGQIDTLTAGPFQHSYANPGVYTVRLTVMDASGCSESRTRSGYVTVSRPAAGFHSPDTLTCPVRNVNFNNLSTGPGLSYFWTFGDGDTSSMQNPVHQYLNNGLFSVTLTVTDQYGCRDTITRNSYVSVRAPIAQFSVSDSVSTCPPLVVNFTNQSQYYTSMSWDFGDSTSTLTPNPSHFYSYSGIFLSQLTVTGQGGCRDSMIIPIRISGPYGTFTYDTLNGCSPLRVRFTASTRDRTSFIWDFNDGNTIATTDSVITHSYTIPGSYLPKMILRDQGGCVVPVTGSDSIHVYGIQAGMAFNQQPFCDRAQIQFDNQSSSNDGIASYQWTFGDGNTSNQANPSHTYTQTGLFYPSLVITSDHQCIDSVTSPYPVRIVASPQGSITQTANGCIPVNIQFNGTLAVADTSQISWQWDFGQGQSSGVQNPAPVTYPVSGQFPVSLIVTNSSGCKDTVLTTVDAYPIPQVSAGPDTLICLGTGRALQASGAATYTWSPSQGLSCTDCANPVANPSTAQNYVVTGTSIHGCRNSDTVRVSVVFPFQMQITEGDTLCTGLSARLGASGAHHYQWFPATGLNDAGIATPIASPTQTTNYQVIGYDDKNCFTDTGFVRVVVYPIPTVEAGADQTINVGQTADLVPRLSSDVTRVAWTPTGSIFRNDYPAVTVKPRETTTYQVTVTNPAGCKASDQVTVHVLCNGSNIFLPNTFSPNSDGNNDQFYPRGSGIFTIKSFRIFNRWGEMIFEKHHFNANDANAGWDGRFKGQLLNPDVFVYMMEVQCDNNSIIQYKGNITLIR